MKLRLKKFRNPRVNALVVLLGKGRTIKFNKIGEESEELDDKTGYEIMGKYSDCLEVVPPPEPERRAPQHKAVKAPQNK